MAHDRSMLVVEDSATQAERLKYLLEEAFPAFTIRVANNGEEAFAAIESSLPVLIISDIVMPVMDGYEMCTHLKNDPRYRSVPVILLTSLSDPEDIIRGLNAGTDYYLTKPYEPDFLLSKISSILEHPRGPESDGNSGWKVTFAGREHVVHADLQQMLNLLLSIYENAVQNNRKLVTLQEELERTNKSLEERVRTRTRELSEANEQLRIEVGERRNAEERLLLQFKRLDALRHVDAAITGSLDLRVTLNVLLDQVTSQLDVDAASVLLQQQSSPKLEFAAGRGFGVNPRRLAGRDFSRGPAGRAVREREMIRLDLERADVNFPLLDEVFSQEAFKSYVAVPLIAKGRAEGVLEIYDRKPLIDDDEWLGFLDALAGQAAIAIDSALLFENLQRSNAELLDAYETTLEGWSQALDLRDKETEGHSLRVTEMTEVLARKLGVDEGGILHMRRGALLHDIGKLAVPDEILRKPGPLTDDERALMQQHTVYAHDWISAIAFLRPAIDIPYSHHEKWDGTGYPQGLKGQQIPLAARIFALADVWDALRSDRPYRTTWSRARCLQHVRELSGSHFDPSIVNAFLALYEELGPDIDQLPDADEDGPRAIDG